MKKEQYDTSPPEDLGQLEQTLQDGLQPTDTIADQTDNSNYYKIERIENSPFTKIYDGENWVIALGQQVVTPNYQTEDKLMEYYNEKSWTMILAVYHAMDRIRKENEKLNLNN